MGELLHRALQGVDPTAPGAAWQIFLNLMGLVPWGAMFALTAVSLIGAVIIARYRGSSVPMAIVWALLLGPAGWLVSWAAVRPAHTCDRCHAQVDGARERCPNCGARLDAP